MGERATVLIDATSVANPRGEGRYLRGLLSALPAELPELRIAALVERSSAEDMPAGIEPILLTERLAPGSRVAAGESRTVAELAGLGLAARRSRCAVLLQPSVVGWFPAPGVPQIVGVHDLKPTGSLVRSMYRGRAQRLAGTVKQALAIRTASALFTVSRHTRSLLRGREGRDATLAPPAVDPAIRPRGRSEALAARRRVGLGPESPFLLVASGLNPHKDPALPVRAISRMRGQGGDPPRVVFAGAGSGSYEPVGFRLEQIARELGVRDLVQLPGHIDDDTLAALFSDCVAAVSCSRWEGFGLTALEARACGARLVLSDIPAHRESSGGEAGFFPVGDAGGLVAALRRTLGRPKPPPLGPAAYSWSRAAAAIASELRRSLASGPSTAPRARRSAAVT